MAVLGIAVLLLAGSLIPSPREWCMPVSPTCSRALARQCLGTWSRCEAMRQSKFRETGRTLPGSLEAAAICMRTYTQQCATCREPSDTGDYWRRLRRDGPWFLNVRPTRLFKDDVVSPTCPYGVSR